MTGLIPRRQTWMSTTPLKMECQEIGIRSHLAMSRSSALAATSALRPEVTRVTVVERDAAHEGSLTASDD